MQDTRPTLERFIVLEGIDGAGTTTQLDLLISMAQARGIEMDADREPTQGRIGSLIRGVLKGELAMEPSTLAHLFAADRWEHVFGRAGIAQRCASGRWVVSDRYFPSSLAYQTLACGNDLPRTLNAPFPLPELVFYLRLEADTAIERIGDRGEPKEIFETRDFLSKTVIEYDRAFEELRAEGATVVILNADMAKADIHERIVRELTERCGFPVMKNLPRSDYKGV
jgi:dTMP kinase